MQVVLSLNPGGTERLVIELATALQEAGCPSSVCCLDDAGSWAAELTTRGIPVAALQRRPGFHPALGYQIGALAKRFQANVIHAHHYSPFVYAAIARTRVPETRLVFTEHGRISDGPPSAKRRLVNRIAFRRAPHRVFAVSGDLRRYMIDEGWGEDQVGVIYNGVNPGLLPPHELRLAIRQRLGITEESLVVGTIARLDPVKDLATLIEACGEVSKDLDVHVVVVGDGPERRALEARALVAGLGGRVHFVGRRDDARAWLAGYDIFVNCSLSEGISLTILEAMAAGLPVVATAVGGTPEVVTSECGLLVPARDPVALARAIGRLCAEPSLRQHMGVAGRHRVERHFTLERMIADYERVYREVA